MCLHCVSKILNEFDTIYAFSIQQTFYNCTLLCPLLSPKTRLRNRKPIPRRDQCHEVRKMQRPESEGRCDRTRHEQLEYSVRMNGSESARRCRTCLRPNFTWVHLGYKNG